MPDQIKADFSSLALSIASSAAMSLGLAPDQETGETRIDKNMAKFNIDMLMMLKDKTKSNLTEDESHLIVSLIQDLQARFIQI
ncbi:MAG: hypothetical protein B7Y39_16850 [Bdellovibrio sp. 28-41-41]|nr:MAG: hypothetical protein B7Y39_16850 [Bdellovibrio sp. 28-41-41]